MPEHQFIAVQALGACCGRASGPLPPDCAVAVLGALSAALTGCCGSGMHLVEDATHSRLYATLLRYLNAALLESRKSWVPQSVSIINALRRMLLYGVPRESRTAAIVPTMINSAHSSTATSATNSSCNSSVPIIQCEL